jgi:UDP-N-acetylmuramoyl-L-alanyl-D-glutamate--2,6-diaminopimelate ligase
LNLTELIGPAATPAPGSPQLDDREIAGITADSRQVRPGFLFAALRGTQTDGRRFAAEAVAKGAVAIVTDDAAPLGLDAESRRRLVVIADPNPQRRLALLAARFYTGQPRTIAAVTGTNGKTSVVHFTREIWTGLGRKAASLGTLGLVSAAGRRAGSLTTPDPVALHRDLANLAGDGTEHVAIEASSHGLAQFRLDGVGIAAAAFTNLTRDHLDYHGDMDAYRAVKRRLFAELLPAGGASVLNADSPEFGHLATVCRSRGHRLIAYGSAPGAELRLLKRAPTHRGQQVRVSVFGHDHDIDLPLVGDFQVMNALAALGLVIGTGTEPPDAVAALPRLSGVPGRMQFVGETVTGGAVFVDYAHTPDALHTVLAALRPHTNERLAVAFGAGGDRDRGKRPMMGRVATELADLVYVTDDNPRSEPPAEIRRQILAAAPDAVEIGDRGEAIASAIAELRRGDILVIAGKGHETGQIVGNTVLPFDDAIVARETIASARRG